MGGRSGSFPDRGRLTTGAALVSPVMRVLNSRIQVNFTN